jgi:hypothetical protein
MVLDEVCINDEWFAETLSVPSKLFVCLFDSIRLFTVTV